MIYYIIPARKNSKGFPFKNRSLFSHTAQLVADMSSNVIVSSDDEKILDEAKKYKFQTQHRSEKNSSDTADVKSVFQEIISEKNIQADDVIVLLYLVHPQRTRDEINLALDFFAKQQAHSLVCRFPVSENPYMCIYENGEPVVVHNFYRRQDYPACYHISHYIAIYRVSEIE